MVRGAAKAHAQEKNAAKQAAMKAGVSTKGVDVAGANAKAIQEREQKRAAKEEAEKAKAAKEAAAKKKLDREAKAREKGGAPKADSDAQLKQLESQLLPWVKKGDALQASGDLDGALALYQEATDGFRGAGFRRPKLKEKLDAVKGKIAAAEPAPEIDQSVEVAGDEEC